MKFTSRYRPVTRPEPSASDNGKLRLGFFTSAAVNVMLFQESDENSDPTIATATTETVPIIQVLCPGGYWCIVCHPALRQKPMKFPLRAASVAKNAPKAASAASVPAFATVNTFCTIDPTRSPCVFSHVSRMIDAIASRFCVFSPTLYGPSAPNQNVHGPNVPNFQIQPCAEKNGKITPVNFANAIATAAIVAV